MGDDDGTHFSKDFDHALQRARQLVEQMGARVERQLSDALETLHSGSPALIAQILRHEAEVNGLERAIDEYGGQIIARRHPAARDLRLVMALLGATTDLERVGDEAKKIALYARSLHASGWTLVPRVHELRPMMALVREMLGEAVQALERLDLEVNQSFCNVLAQLARFMVGPARHFRVPRRSLRRQSLERIGDHAKNIGEHAVYAAMGADVRHATVHELERLLHR